MTRDELDKVQRFKAELLSMLPLIEKLEKEVQARTKPLEAERAQPKRQRRKQPKRR